jgi:hypothetical protein
MNSAIKNEMKKNSDRRRTENAWPNNVKLTAKEKKGLEVIYQHTGKRLVFETYLKYNPEMARKYLSFVSEHLWARYMIWNKHNKSFELAY